MSNKQRAANTLFAPASGKVHPAGEAGFPLYDFFQQEQAGERQSERLLPALEACRDGWRRRLEAMLYRSELSLDCRVREGAPAPAEQLHFLMEHQWDGRLQASAALHIEHATLYRLAEMTFGGQPLDSIGPLRAVSETERRLGASLLGMITDDLVARILPEAVPGCARMLAGAAEFEVETQLAFDIHFAGQHLGWTLTLPALRSAEPEALPVPADGGLTEALNASLPRLSTHLSVPLATFELPLGQIAELNEGDVLPINLLQEVVARAGEQPVLKGRVAERDGMLVFASHGFID
ncbi:FliM/FliN family flagellar motor switch protein [Oceanimonas sp. CHS3-5]|uniref:FliM/FliN family flagellar motor switch protein n=1 Tax=Oceanimonas sp. CHS3-5 TaxID=3068186 RepID=UPI00273E0215|nr:FliM/FliN family flagellar motor switch protein [Oceanimonas sp. CHS3-5]MDP5292409.1 FliM/FliN family flagellar motor switch protein [Oceanimonas sp. CHS3-5]